MAGSAFAGLVGSDRDPSLAFLSKARAAVSRGSPVGERPLEARLRTLQATAGNAAVGQFLQRQTADETGAGAGAGAGGAAAPTKSYSNLTYGSRGDEVRDLQVCLNQAKAARPALVVDGIYGRKTQAAVRAFQRANPPLTIDGDAGPETRQVLEHGPAEATTGGGAEATTDAAPTADGAAEPVDPYEAGKAHYAAERYGQAYDEFTKAHESSGDPAHLWNRAQSLRLVGGRREEAIALFEQLMRMDLSDDVKGSVRERLTELKGPGKSTDKGANDAAVLDLHKKGAAFYQAEQFGRAYDEFTKAHQITNDPALLWNRAQALRLLGGRRAETIALYEQFIAANVPEDNKAAARIEITELRGPGKSTDEAASKSAADALFTKGKEHYAAEHYAQAYDEFSKAHEISGDPALLFNRAQSLRLVGGRRAEAIALYEQFLAGNASDEAKKAARAFLADLRGAGKKAEPGTQPPP